jgi:tRNA threonylcarbamoyl adenosine modification protein YjeE
MKKKKSLEWLDCSEEQLSHHLQSWIQNHPARWDNTIVFLSGEMGAGKSTFCRLFLKHLGVADATKGSPTFPIIHQYDYSLFPVIHMDLYRLEAEDELLHSGVDDIIRSSGGLIFIEWSERFPNYFRYWKESDCPGSTVMLISLKAVEGQPELRNITIEFN